MQKGKTLRCSGPCNRFNFLRFRQWRYTWRWRHGSTAGRGIRWFRLRAVTPVHHQDNYLQSQPYWYLYVHSLYHWSNGYSCISRSTHITRVSEYSLSFSLHWYPIIQLITKTSGPQQKIYQKAALTECKCSPTEVTTYCIKKAIFRFLIKLWDGTLSVPVISPFVQTPPEILTCQLESVQTLAGCVQGLSTVAPLSLPEIPQTSQEVCASSYGERKGCPGGQRT